MKHRRTGFPSSSPYYLALPFLVLGTLFLVFLDYNGYCLACPETLLSFLALAIVGLTCSALVVAGRVPGSVTMAAVVLVFIDVQFSVLDRLEKLELAIVALVLIGLFWTRSRLVYSALLAMFGTAFAASAVQLAWPAQELTAPFHRAPIASGSDLPRLIHIILDEHIGMRGIPQNVRGGPETLEGLERFYKQNGFANYRGAFSRYHNTHNALPSALNFTVIRSDRELLTDPRPEGGSMLRSNRYFELLSAAGYRTYVLQSMEVDMCGGRADRFGAEACVAYPTFSLSPIMKLPLPVSTKASGLLSRLAGQSRRYRRVRTVYNRWSGALHRFGSPIPSWSWDREIPNMSALNSMNALDRIASEVGSLKPGEALVAHLLLPHYPYAFMSNCSVRLPIKNWKTRHPAIQGPHTEESREERYELYLEQVGCLYLRLNEIFSDLRSAGTYDETVILLHGDHGSRIAMTEPRLDSAGHLPDRDVVDHFSTLFAVKPVNGKPSVNDEARPLDLLLREFSVNTLGLPLGARAGKSSRDGEVFIIDGDRPELLSYPYPTSPRLE